MSHSGPPSLANFVARVDTALKTFKNSYKTMTDLEAEGTDDEVIEEATNELQACIQQTLRLACDVARSAAGEGALPSDELQTLLKKASELEQTVVMMTLGHEFLYEYIPVSCGKDVTDEAMGIGLGAGVAGLLLSMVPGFSNDIGADRAAIMVDILNQSTGTAQTPYDSMPKPSPYSSPLARFSTDRPALPLNASPDFRSFAEARCEVASDYLWEPAKMSIGGEFLAIVGGTGWKYRDPALRVLPLSYISQSEPDEINSFDIPVAGMKEALREVLVDGANSLVYAADNKKIKFFSSPTGGSVSLMDTLSSDGFDGPLALRNNGTKVLRAGMQGIAVWDKNDTSQLGTTPTHHIRGADLGLIDKWADHPTDVNAMIVSHHLFTSTTLVDLEAQKLVTRYLGHGGPISTIRTNAADPSSFMTAACDGAVRLYDVRLPTPVLAIFHRDEPLRDALYEHIGGQPFVILGGTKSEQIKVWDVRAQRPLYELSTGNNSVHSLAWDAPRKVLYAATECIWKGRTGQYLDYRRADFPACAGEGSQHWGWPEQAFHNETSFGHPLDSGEGRLFRYKFTENADVQVMPHYGMTEF